MNNLNSGKNNDLLGLPRLAQMISVRCANNSINSILIIVFLWKDAYALQWNLMYFFSNLKMRILFVNMLGGLSEYHHKMDMSIHGPHR
jgi:hypothetical protein